MQSQARESPPTRGFQGVIADPLRTVERASHPEAVCEMGPQRTSLRVRDADAHLAVVRASVAIAPQASVAQQTLLR
jgi:hypothetical protein